MNKAEKVNVFFMAGYLVKKAILHLLDSK